MPAASSLERGVELRRAGRYAEAISNLESATREAPADADAWLALGLAYSAAQRFEHAEEALSRAQRLAPAYADVQLARARLAFFRQDLPEAERRLSEVIASEPGNSEARALIQQIADARKAVRPTWRIDLTGSQGNLTKGLPSARTGAAALSRTHAGVTLSGSVEHVRQFSQSDTYLEGGLATRRGYFAAGAAPSADFRPHWALRVGLLGAPLSLRGPWITQASVDGSVARYPAGTVYGLHPSLTLSQSEALSLSVRWINVMDETSNYRTGYALRGLWRAQPQLALSAGWSAAPESSEGRTVRARTASAGAAFDLSESLTIRIDVFHEQRRAYDRDVLSLGATRRF